MDRVVSEIDIHSICADIKQPRRVFPANVRGGWLGSPVTVADKLRIWLTSVEGSLHKKIDVKNLVQAKGDKIDKCQNAVIDDFLDLCRLAATIGREGMTNAITVVKTGTGSYMIETGERRWLAHFLLEMYHPDDRFGRIEAKVVDQFDLYRQASENTARKKLNAVGTTRALARLIMGLFPNANPPFQSWEVCVRDGCDRQYYAQVSNATHWGIPKGHLSQILIATGIADRAMVSHYRDILTLPDNMWVRADEENWPEGRCRKVLETEKRANEHAVHQRRQQEAHQEAAAKISRKTDESTPPVDDDRLSTDNVLTWETEGDSTLKAGDIVNTPDGLAEFKKQTGVKPIDGDGRGVYVIRQNDDRPWVYPVSQISVVDDGDDDLTAGEVIKLTWENMPDSRYLVGARVKLLIPIAPCSRNDGIIDEGVIDSLYNTSVTVTDDDRRWITIILDGNNYLDGTDRQIRHKISEVEIIDSQAEPEEIAVPDEPDFEFIVGDRVNTPSGLGYISNISETDQFGISVKIDKDGDSPYHRTFKPGRLSFVSRNTSIPGTGETEKTSDLLSADDALPVIDTYPELEELLKILMTVEGFGIAADSVEAMIGLSEGIIKQEIAAKGFDDFDAWLIGHLNIIGLQLEGLVSEYHEFFDDVIKRAEKAAAINPETEVPVD